MSRAIASPLRRLTLELCMAAAEVHDQVRVPIKANLAMELLVPTEALVATSLRALTITVMDVLPVVELAPAMATPGHVIANMLTTSSMTWPR